MDMSRDTSIYFINMPPVIYNWHLQAFYVNSLSYTVFSSTKQVLESDREGGILCQ